MPLLTTYMVRMKAFPRINPRTLALGSIVLLAACASHLPAIGSNVTLGSAPVAMPSPALARNGARPRVLAMHFSSLNVARGGRWSGEFVTGSNVASVEVRTNLFSIDVPRTQIGRFAFDLNVLDTPPIFVRKYRLRVIARNSAGVTSETDLPFEIR